MKAYQRAVKTAKSNRRYERRQDGYESEGDYLFAQQKAKEEKSPKTIGDTLEKDPDEQRVYIITADMPEDEGGE